MTGHASPSLAAEFGSFDSLNPATGEVVGTFRIHDAADVDAAVARAREASLWWRERGFEGRREYLVAWRNVVTRRMDELAELIHRETGKPLADARLEIGFAVDHLSWAAKNARKVLGRRRRNPGILLPNQMAWVEYQPLGVVGVIGPWNYPIFTPMGSIAHALAAGNTVVFKPSEHTPAVGVFLAETLLEVTHGREILQTVTGFAETGNALCIAAIDKLAFTGSGETGKKVMAACAQNLTPVIIEGGGKDALIVDEDVDIAVAAEATLWNGMSNAGQTCIGTERVYVHEKIFQPFMTELLNQAGEIRPGYDDGGDYGPATMPAQLETVRGHIEDAVARGGIVALGGVDAVGDRYVMPTIITHVPEESTAITEETFGPVLVVNPVSSMDEAIALTNGTGYGLAGAVFSRADGMRIARSIRSGMTSINSVIAFVAIPSLPFGGVGGSGFGRIHGADGLREFTYAKSIAEQRVRPVVMLPTFRRTPQAEERFATIISLLHGGASSLRGRFRRG